ncbi:MAG: carboxypeptidase-like regulatory domain-containing protein, partial [Vicinamibacterales bacterium]
MTASSAWAASVSGVVSDVTGAVIPGATVVFRELATGRERAVTTGGDGKYSFDGPETGAFLLVVTRRGFSEA